MARRKLFDDDYMDIAVVALLRGLERIGRDRAVLNELTPRKQEEVFQAEARGMNIIRGRRDDTSTDDGEADTDDLDVHPTPDGPQVDAAPSAAARASPALHLPDQTDPQPHTATPVTPALGPGPPPGPRRAR